MKKHGLFYAIAFALLALVFFLFSNAYRELNHYTYLTNRSSTVLARFQSLSNQINNAAVISPDLIMAERSSQQTQLFLTDSLTVLKELSLLKAVVKDSVNIGITKQLDTIIHAELSWMLRSNVPDSILHHRAGLHVAAIVLAESLIRQGIARTGTLQQIHKEGLHRAISRVRVWMILFILIAATLLAYTAGSFLRQRSKSKKIEKDLQYTENRFRYTLDNMLEGIQIHDRQWRYTYVNDALVKYSTYTRDQLLGHTLMELYPGIEQTDLFHAMERCMAGGPPEQMETEFTFPNGTKAYFSVSLEPSPEGLFILSVDITQKKKLEEEQALFASIVEYTDDAILSKSLDGLILSWNHGAENVFGYSTEEMVGQHISRLIPPHLVHEENAIISKIRAGEVVDHYETERIKKDGSTIYVSLTISPIRDLHGKITGASKISRDITEKRRIEEKLLKANRLYAFISAINQSIVHISDRQQLLDTACTIATEVGHFKIAWIGMLDDAGSLIMVSREGDPAAIAHLKKYSGQNYSDPPLSLTSTGRALASGKYATSNDVQNDPAMSTWREHHITHGIRANISLPIKKHGKVVGIYGLNSESVDFFDNAEIALLTEAAGDISFALELFDKEAKRKEGEILLAQNEARLERAQRIAHLGHWELNSATGVGIWSEEACRIFGLDPADCRHTFDEWAAFVHPADKDRVIKTINTQLRSLSNTTFDHRIIRRDGSIRYVHSETKFEFDEANKPRAIYGIFHDITDIKQAEEQLRKRESQLNDAQTLAQVGSFEVDMATGAIEWSDEMYRLMGYAPRSVVPSNELFFARIHADDLDYMMGEFGRIFASFEEASAYMRMTSDTGKLRDVFCEYKFELDSDGQPVRLYGILQDITERKKAERDIIELNEKLQASNYQLSTIFNTLPANIALLDDAGEIIAVNKGWKQFADENDLKNPDHCLGDNYIEVCENVTGQDAPVAAAMAIDMRALLTRQIEEFAMEYPCHSPLKKRWFRAEVRPLTEEHQAGAVVMHFNITERKEAEEEIIQMNNTLETRVTERTTELQEANNALESFSYSVSHDLRAPVRAMIGFTAIIEKEYGPGFNEDLREMFGHIRSSSKRMNAIIDDMMTLAKYEKEKIHPHEVDMQMLFQSIWDNISFASPHHALLKMGELPTVMADSSMIQQVVVNLLSNAIKYSSKKETPIVHVNAEVTVSSVIFCIQDNGAGFDMKNYGRLFGAFQRLHGTSEFEGTGVGLLLVKRIVEKHGGSVWAEGKVGEGATFYFSLPV